MKMRIRTIKPEIHEDEELWDAEVETGLPLFRAFVALWSIADREGRFRWSPRVLGPLCLRFWDGDFSRVLDALERGRFLVRYEVDGRPYGLVRRFSAHQVVNKREEKSRLPAPPETHVHARALHVNAHAPHVTADAGPGGVDAAQVRRETVLARDGHRCARCKAPDDLDVDHIFPRSIGGTDVMSNLRTLCKSCSSARPASGQALLDDLGKDGLGLEDMQRMCMHVHSGARTWGTGTGTGTGTGSPLPPLGAEGPRSGVSGRPDGPQDREQLGDAMRREFRAQWLKARKADPSMGGRNLGDFASRVEATAGAQHVDPMDLFVRCLGNFLSGPLDEVALRAPYAVFASRFGEIADACGPSADAEEHRRRELRKAKEESDREMRAQLGKRFEGFGRD